MLVVGRWWSNLKAQEAVEANAAKEAAAAVGKAAAASSARSSTEVTEAATEAAAASSSFEPQEQELIDLAYSMGELL